MTCATRYTMIIADGTRTTIILYLKITLPSIRLLFTIRALTILKASIGYMNITKGIASIANGIIPIIIHQQ
jgi:hypothetical protein